MFTFFRTRTGPAEFWEILIAEGLLPDAGQRFGPPQMYRGPGSDDTRFHHVGNIAAIVTDADAEFLLACRELSDEEQRVLDQQLELLLGHHVWSMGAEPIKGYFVHDTLKPWSPPPGVA